MLPVTEDWAVRRTQRSLAAASGLLVGSISHQHMQMGEVTADIVMSDYKEFDGLKLPTRMTMTMGPQQVVTTIKSVTHEPIADSVFALPPEIRALRH